MNHAFFFKKKRYCLLFFKIIHYYKVYIRNPYNESFIKCFMSPPWFMSKFYRFPDQILSYPTIKNRHLRHNKVSVICEFWSCYSKCGPRTSNMVPPRSLLKMQDFRPFLDHLNFDKISGCYLCTSGIEKHWSIPSCGFSPLSFCPDGTSTSVSCSPTFLPTLGRNAFNAI